MKEIDIKNVLCSKNISELIRKMSKFYPNGFDINKIDIRIKEKIIELENKYAKYNNSIAEIRRFKYRK